MPKYNDFDLDLQKDITTTTEAILTIRACDETIQYHSCCRPCDDTLMNYIK